MASRIDSQEYAACLSDVQSPLIIIRLTRRHRRDGKQDERITEADEFFARDAAGVRDQG